MKPLLGLVPQAKYPLRLVEADLSKPETWTKAVKRCTYVFHVASPFPPGATNEAEIVKTAVEGTTTVLQACADAGTVKRVVVTSSLAAVSAGSVGDPEKTADYVYTEKDWSVESVCTPYIKSKLKAERAAWDLVKDLDESKRFELAVVNPGYVQGPLLSANSGEGSKEFAQRLLNGKMPALADVTIAMVDVRDVAAAHIAAMEKSEAAGNRYILSCRTVNFKEYAQIIDNEFRPQGYKITTRTAPKVVLWVSKFFDSGVKQIYSSLGKNIQVSNDRMVNELGIHPRPVEKSIIDTCYSLVDLGLAKKTPGYLGHPSTRPPPPEPQATNEEAVAAKNQSQPPPQEGVKEKSQPESDKGQNTEDKPSESQQVTPEEGEKTEDKPSEPEPSPTEPTATEGVKTEDKPSEPEPSVAEPTATEGAEKTEDKPSEPEPSPTEPTATEGVEKTEDKPEPSPTEPTATEEVEKTEDKPSEPEPSVAEPTATDEASGSQPAREEGESSEDKPAEGDSEEQQKDE